MELSKQTTRAKSLAQKATVAVATTATLVAATSLLGGRAMAATYDWTSTATIDPPGSVFGQVQPGQTFLIDFSSIFSSFPSTGSWEFNIASLSPQVGSSVSYKDLQWESRSSTTSAWTARNWSDFGPFTMTNATFSPSGTLATLNINEPGGLVSTKFTKPTGIDGARIGGTLVSTTGTSSNPAQTDFRVSSYDTIGISDGTFASDLQSSVPGPLPVLGALSAFAWSRRLRKRVQPHPLG